MGTKITKRGNVHCERTVRQGKSRLPLPSITDTFMKGILPFHLSVQLI